MLAIIILSIFVFFTALILSIVPEARRDIRNYFKRPAKITGYQPPIPITDFKPEDLAFFAAQGLEWAKPKPVPEVLKVDKSDWKYWPGTIADVENKTFADYNRIEKTEDKILKEISRLERKLSNTEDYEIYFKINSRIIELEDELLEW